MYSGSLYRALGYESVSYSLVDLESGRWNELTQMWLRRGVAIPANWTSPASVKFMRAGWPFYCFSGEEWYHSVDETRAVLHGPPADSERIERIWSITLPEFLSSRGTGEAARAVPMRPQPIAFLANIVVFALMLLTGVASVRLVIAWRRLRAGRCLICGYCLHACTRCPECGSVWR